MIDLQLRLQRLREKARTLHAIPSAEPSLGERLERLRVATSVCRPATPESLAASLQGQLVAPGLVELVRTYPLPLRHGEVTVANGRSLGEVAGSLGGLASPVAAEGLLCLDTETTGLSAARDPRSRNLCTDPEV